MNYDDWKLESSYNDKPLFEPCKCDVCGDYFERDDMKILGINNDNYDEDSLVCEWDFDKYSINFI